MEKCPLAGAGGLACAGLERNSTVSIDGELRRLRVCGVHHDYLRQVSTPLPVRDPLATQAAPEAKKRGRGRPALARTVALSCLLDDGTEISWPAVRAKLVEWGREVPGSGPIPAKEIEYFKQHYQGATSNGG